MTRYALIGAGMMGREHIQNILLQPGAEVSAIADPSADMCETSRRLAGRNCRIFDGHQQLIDQGDFDALIIASPNHTHAAILKDTLKIEVPILVEKPLGISTAECRAIVEQAQARSAPVWVAMEYRYKPPVAKLIDEVKSGNVGSLKMITIREHRYPFLEKVADWNRFNENTGGTMVEKCCHFFDLFTLIAQAEPMRVYASAAMDVNHINERYDGKTPDIIDNGFVIVDFDNGVRAMLDLCMFADGTVWQEQITVTGDNASLEANVPGPATYAPNSAGRDANLSYYPRQGAIREHEPVLVDPDLLAVGDHHGATYYQHQKFHNAVVDGGPCEVTLIDGLRAVVVGEAAEQSARTGLAVDLNMQELLGD